MREVAFFLKCNTGYKILSNKATPLGAGGGQVLQAYGFFAFSICHVIQDFYGVSITSYGESVTVKTRGNENISGSD